MEYKLPILCYCRFLLEGYVIKLHSINIVVHTFLCLRFKKKYYTLSTSVWDNSLFFFPRVIWEMRTAYSSLWNYSQKSFITSFAEGHKKSPPFSFWLLLFFHYYSLVAQFFELLWNIKLFLSQKNMHNDIKHISIYLAFSGIKSNYNL